MPFSSYFQVKWFPDSKVVCPPFIHVDWGSHQVHLMASGSSGRWDSEYLPMSISLGAIHDFVEHCNVIFFLQLHNHSFYKICFIPCNILFVIPWKRSSSSGKHFFQVHIVFKVWENTWHFVLFPISFLIICNILSIALVFLWNNLSYKQVLFMNYNELLRNNNFISAAAIFIFLCAWLHVYLHCISSVT